MFNKYLLNNYYGPNILGVRKNINNEDNQEVYGPAVKDGQGMEGSKHSTNVYSKVIVIRIRRRNTGRYSFGEPGGSRKGAFEGMAFKLRIEMWIWAERLMVGRGGIQTKEIDNV